MKINDYSKSREEYLRACKVIPSGIYGHQGPAEGCYTPVEAWPLFSSRAQGSYFWDVDGTAKLSIQGGPAAALCCRDHRLLTIHKAPEHPLSYMEFADMHLARDLFDGKVNAIAAVGAGQVRIGGMISQIDNINRILDRVAVYLG